MNQLNAAVIGCGAIGPVHLEGLAACSSASIAAVCDIEEDKARSAGEKYGCKYYTDYKFVLKDPEINVIHICTPHYLHAPIAIEAMKNGKHVLTEKPIATNTSDALGMIRVSEETGQKLGVCFQNRYNTTSVKIKELLDSGCLERVKGAKAFVTWHREGAYYTDSGWRGTWEREGGGVLINQSIHTLDLLQWFLGELDGLKGSAQTRLLGDIIEVEDTADATIKFKSGAVGLFYATNCYATDSPVELEILCEKAVLKLSEGLTVKYADGSIERVEETDLRTGQKAYWGCGHAVLINDFYTRLLDGKDIAVDGRQAITTIKMIEAIYRSSKSGEYIKLDE